MNNIYKKYFRNNGPYYKDSLPAARYSLYDTLYKIIFLTPFTL